MSPTTFSQRNAAGVKGKRVAGKPGRFDPSVPLHMTTRKRARKPSNDLSPSANGSVWEDESTRSSLEDGRPSSSRSQLSQDSAELDVPEISRTAATPDITFSMDQSNAGEESFESPSKSHLPEQYRASPSRKRKRNTDSPPAPTNGSFVAPTTSHQDADPYEVVNDAMDVDSPALMSEREVSDESTQTRDQNNDAVAIGVASVDATPIVSEAASPASSVSGEDETSPQKQTRVEGEETFPTTQENLADDVEDAEDEDDVDEQLQSGDESRPTRRPGGKRRRAVHPDDKVEMAMRRSLDIRKAYRNTVRDMKAVLADIAQRQMNNLNENPTCHEESTEHENVKGDLDEAYEKRCRLVRDQQRFNQQHLEQRLVDEKHVATKMLQLRLQDAEDAFLDRVERQLLEIGRAVRSTSSTIELDTDDEDDIIPKPKRMGYRFRRGSALDPAYQSRSLSALETEWALDLMQRRLAMQRELENFREDGIPKPAAPFTVMERSIRDSANAKKDSVTALNTMVNAANEIETLSGIPVIPNEEATGLQLLGDLASRPSIVVPAQGTLRAKQGYEDMASRTPAHHAANQAASATNQDPPQQAQHRNSSQSLPKSHSQQQPQPPRIEFTASPRARQLLDERYETKKATPLSQSAHVARQNHAAFSPPDARQGEPSASSPKHQREQTDSLPPLAAKPNSDIRQRPPEPSPLRLQSPFGLPREESNQKQTEQGPVHPRSSPGLGNQRSLTSASDGRLARSSISSPFDFLFRNAPLTEEALTTQSGASEEIRNRSSLDQVPFPHNILQPQTQERPASPGAADTRQSRTERSPFGAPLLGPEATQSRRGSSVVVKQEAGSDSSQIGDQTGEQKSSSGQDSKGNKTHINWRKTNKAERNGVSRRAHKNKNKERRHHSVGEAGYAGPPQTDAATLAQSPVERKSAFPLPPPPHVGLPGHQSPQSMRPPHNFGALLHGPEALPPERWREDYGGSNQHQHRNSFPPPPPPPPHWPQLQNDIFPLPPIRHQPPPPHGVSADQYRSNQGFPTVPPPPPFPPPTPNARPFPAPPAGLGPWNSQYGGPALAPATPDSRFHPTGLGPQPGPLPAFAQQQRHEPPHRKRGHSDTHVGPADPGWKGWKPYSGPGRR
ncbi:hypothetical protein D0866_08151 [Hortaea werneckii]|uniref:Uncharacterized protein n=1 Tax=Hortaea werneckii TaxID=91943 RepID=A0A3M7AS33_HORWE|nr:hypothetical protein D0866_08151 [Hortaea werneckii]